MAFTKILVKRVGSACSIILVMSKTHRRTAKNVRVWLLVFFFAALSYLLGGVIGGGFYLLVTVVLGIQVPESGSIRLLFNLLTGIFAYGAIFVALYFGLKKFWKQPDPLKSLGMRGRLTWQGVVL